MKHGDAYSLLTNLDPIGTNWPSAQEFQILLGDLGSELIKNAHRDAAIFKESIRETKDRKFKRNRKSSNGDPGVSV